MRVMNHVRQAVQQGTMVPGQWYSAYRLADELGISRSPVRDGLLRLEEAGLISFTRNRGFQIVPADPSVVAELFGLRLGIEPPAAYRAASLRTDEQLLQAREVSSQMLAAAHDADEQRFFEHDRELHRLIMTMGNARRATEIVDRIRDHTVLLGHSTAGRSRSLHDILLEHQPILEAVEQGDGRQAADSMRRHLESTGKLLLAQAARAAEVSEAQALAMWDDYTAGIGG